jgi:hypothetical protein
VSITQHQGSEWRRLLALPAAAAAAAVCSADAINLNYLDKIISERARPRVSTSVISGRAR